MMRNENRRWETATVCGLACLLLFNGCSQGKGQPKIFLYEEESSVVVTFFAQGTAPANAINACCEKNINEAQNGHIILYSDSADYYAEEGLSYRELLLKRMESGQSDDLYLIPAEDVLEFEQKGYLYDLSGLSCIQNLSEDALQQSTYDGKVFSIPLSYTCFGLLWNVDMLHQYNLEIPQNKEEFWAVCDVLKANGILPYGANMDFGLSVPAMCAGLGPLYQDPEAEALLEELAAGKVPVSRYMREGFSFLQDMLDKGYLDPAQAMETLPNSEEETALFREGKCASISAFCRAKTFSQNYPFEVKMTAFPVLEEGEICVVGADQRLAVNPNSQHLEETLSIVQNLCTTETLNSFAEELGKISSARGNKAATLPQADSLVSCVSKGNQVPNQDFTLHFNTWNTIKALCLKLCQGESVDSVCREYDELQLQEIAQYCP